MGRCGNREVRGNVNKLIFTKKNILLAMFGFHTLPANDGRSFWAFLFGVLRHSMVSLLVLKELPFVASSFLVTSALDLHHGPPSCSLFGPMGTLGFTDLH